MPQPQQQGKPQAGPDFIPAQAPDFIPADGSEGAPQKPPGAIEQFDQKFVAPQMAPPNESAMHHVGRAISNFGGGGIGAVTAPFLHPIETAKSAFSMSPVGMAWNAAHGAAPPGAGMAESYKEHPEETIESGLGNLVGSADMAGVAGELPAISKTAGELNQRYNPLPLRSRAVNTLNSVEKDAANVPVSMAETDPAVQQFRQSVNTGGPNSRVMRQLGRRIEPEQMQAQGPVNFPEARDFYTNVSRESARPGFLRRAIESPSKPALRMNLGNVREAMNADLTSAADQVGRGEDYTGGMKEYANNAKLRKMGIIGAGVAGEELARRTGLLGKIAPKLMGQ